MNRTAVLAAMALIFFGLNSVSAETSERATVWHHELTNKTFSMHGKFHSVNTSAKTFTIRVANDLFVFALTDQTKIAKDGRIAPLNAATFDGELDLVMKIAPDGRGTALAVTSVSRARPGLHKAALQDGFPVPRKLYGAGWPTRR